MYRRQEQYDSSLKAGSGQGGKANPTYLRRKASTNPMPCRASVVYKKTLIDGLQKGMY